MLVAAANGHFEVAQVLLEYGSNIYDTDQAERNLVFVAAIEGHADFLNAILQRADVASLVNECDQYQNTAVHLAAKNGHHKTLLALIRVGASIGMKNVEEETPMHKAAKFGREKIIEELNSRDSKLIFDVDSNNDTPLHLAARGSHYKAVKMLLDLGADSGKFKLGDFHFFVNFTCKPKRCSKLKVLDTVGLRSCLRS